NFIAANREGLKAAAVSGNSERHPDTFCGAAEKLEEKYGVKIIAKFEKDGNEAVEQAIKELL
ncbi:MAG: class Ib ribonucleoside-diphosphate reductase assembly flavoprotein NrdI, partial [Clostridia bacterium]|nr:class Ib ribonucleoside-diphosphate reductase assembly flavoprotein NrdI [Clostridia bacterium]